MPNQEKFSQSLISSIHSPEDDEGYNENWGCKGSELKGAETLRMRRLIPIWVFSGENRFPFWKAKPEAITY